MATPRLASSPAFPYRDDAYPGQHEGIVTIPATGVLTVDLGIGHNNFFVKSILTFGGPTDLVVAPQFAWAYGTNLGTFTITVYSRPASYGAWIAATAAVSVSFSVAEHRS